MDEKEGMRERIIMDILRWRDEKGKKTGKTTIQKLVYLMEYLGLPLDYEYTLYTYGPYSKKLMGELEFMREKGLIEIVWNYDYAGYEISIQGTAPEVEIEKRDIIEKVLSDYGTMNAAELELIATILYLKKRFDTPLNDLVEEVRKVKPKYSEERVGQTIYDLISRGYLEYD